MDRIRLAFKERLRHFGWLRWVAGVNALIMVVDEVKMKRCNILQHTKTRRKSITIT